MSGHSKWATIKRAKGAADLKRGLTFTKISNAITVAVKASGGIADPNSNFKLRLAVDAARAANMPKENIERAIQKAIGEDTGEVSEVIYEGFAPEGVSVIIEAATDNTMRTTSEIKSIFNKDGGNFGQPGSVAYQFEQKGRIIINKNGKTIDELFEIALQSGAEDIEDIQDKAIIQTSYADLSSVRERLMEKGMVLEAIETIRKPLIPIVISDPAKLEKVVNFLDKIGALDDVQKVYSNLA
ncbi:MAG: transcriptional regulator [Candidatus Levybacteria bacterium GW2011_GWA1_37_16]|nr:MAG: transcriptional regulator [Candidatus Levybacteria bacterium GW2011_GWA1_37_16]KKQ41019.1 MAG: transcriptional regulator [Candidatus Levybacteria bacterium GW2011_GWB1_37_8]